MNTLSRNMRYKLLPLLLIFTVVLAGFSLILWQNYTSHILEQHLEKQMINATARMALGELIVSNLRKVEAHFYKAIITKDHYAQQLIVDDALVTIAEIHAILNILENGGIFSRTLSLNMDSKDRADLSISYFPIHKQEVIIAVLSLRPQLMDLKKKFNELTAVTANRNRILGELKGSLSAEEEQVIRYFVKKIDPLLVRMTENANKLDYDGEKNLLIFQNKIRVAREANMQTELLWALSAVGAVLILIGLIFRQILLTQQAQQKMLFELQQTEENLQESNKEILTLNETLEEQVASRTMELTSANRTLTEEIDVRRKTEEELRQSKEIWERTFDSSPDVVTIFNPSMVIVRANSMARQFFSLDDKIEGHYCYELFHGSAQPCSDCPILEAETKFQPYVREMYNEKLQKTFLVSAAPVLDKMGNLDYITHFAKDITEMKEALDKVRLQKAYIENIFNLVPQGLITVNQEKKPIEWNLSLDIIVISWAEKMKMQEIEVRDELFRQLGHELEAKDNGIFSLSLKEQSLHFEFFSSAIPSSDNIYRVVSLRDVTEITAMERQLAQSQKLEAVGRLAAGIAHEINTPTQYVSTNVEFLVDAHEDIREMMACLSKLLQMAKTGTIPVDFIEETEESVEEADWDFLQEEIPSALSQSREGLNRIAEIVSAMKRFSHPGSSSIELHDLNKAIESTVTVARNEWKYVAEMELKLDKSLPRVPCILDELNQVILNIIVNSAHAIEEMLKETPDKKGKICITTSLVHDYAEILLSDNGTGMSKDVSRKIFEPFFTTKVVGKGTGQGLAIAHDVIVDKHKGTIDVTSNEGEGTSFVIRLPLETAG